MNSENFKKIFAIMICLFLLAGCGNKEETVTESSGIEEIKETVEARTAIIFKIMEGNGTLVYRDGTSEEVYEGMRILSGDSIVTDSSSSVYCRVDDDKNILLEKDSKMNVLELKDGTLGLEIEYGSFFFNVKNKLKSDESMYFKSGCTSLSVRGTSGVGSNIDGRGSFAIYTGVGAFKQEGNDKEFTIMPNMIAHFDTEDSDAAIDLAPLKTEEISSLLKEYLKDEEQSDYKNDLKELGWTINEEGITEPEFSIIEDSDDSKYLGWSRNDKGEWVFSLEDFENGIGPKDSKTEENPVVTIPQKTIFKTEEKVIEEEVVEQTASSEPVLISIDEPKVQSLSITYDGLEHSLELKGYDAKTMILTGEYSGKDVGTYKVSITPKEGYCFKDGSNAPVKGTLTINPIELDIQDIGSLSKVYDGEPNGRIAYEGSELSRILEGEEVNIFILVDTESKDVGEYENASLGYEMNGLGIGNYRILYTSQYNCDFAITAKPVEIGMTVSGKAYDGSALDAENITDVSLDGVLEEDDVTVRTQPASGYNVGTYQVSTSLTGEDASNYSIQSVNGNEYTISKRKVTGSLATSNKTYDGEAMNCSGFTATFNNVVEGETIAYSVSGNSSANAGTYEAVVSCSGDVASNYEIAQIKASYTINKRKTTLSISPQDVEVTYKNDLLNSIGFNIKSSNVLDRDKSKLSYIAVSGDDTFTSVPVNKSASYTVTPVLNDSNYEVTEANGVEFYVGLMDASRGIYAVYFE